MQNINYQKVSHFTSIHPTSIFKSRLKRLEPPETFPSNSSLSGIPHDETE